MPKVWTHQELCKKAVGFLRRSYRAGGYGCPNAFIEVNSGSNGRAEIADAIGLKTSEGTETILIEAKTSRSDFLADRKKPWRKDPSRGMGNYRYFICPEGLIQPSDLPPKWGLIYVDHRGKLSVVFGHKASGGKEWWFESNRDAELGMASIMLGKVKNLGDLDEATRLNRRLEEQVQTLQKKLDRATHNQRMNEIINALEEISAETNE